MEELELYFDLAKEMMEKAVQHTTQEFAKIRAGKAVPSMLHSINVEYYGNITPLNQVASITTPDARTLNVKPWEKNMLQEIEKAILHSGLGYNPQSDGEQLRINIPPLTEERRLQLLKQARNEAEKGKVSIRNARKETNDGIKKITGISKDMIHDMEDSVQKLTNSYVDRIDQLIESKEKDLMTI